MELHAWHTVVYPNDPLQLTFESGGVVLDAGQVQIVIPPLCVLIHAVMIPLQRVPKKTNIFSIVCDYDQE